MAKQCMIFIAYHIKKNSGKPNNMLLVVHHVLPFPICRVRSLLRAPTPSGVTSQLLKKTTTKKCDVPFLHSRPLAPHVCG